MKRTLQIAAATALLALPAAAHDHAAFTYSDFEASVPHIDLDECPAGLAQGDVFCRITMNNDALHIFVFEVEGDQHFVSVNSYYEDEFELVFER